MGTHNKAVASIAREVAGFFTRGQPFRIFHGSTNSTRPRHNASQPVIDISALSNVLHVDQKAQTALVEPNVPMDKLVEATLAHRLIPPVVMEFPGITAGGGVAGTSGESSSFRHGFFNSIVEEVEMVLGNGEVVTAKRNNEHADLFRGAAGAMGSLGLTTLLKIKLMPAKTYVALAYHRTTSVAEAVARIRAETEGDQNDYVDGILYSKDHGAIITGKLTDDKPAETPVQTFSHACAVTDYIPLAEYLFRYDRGGFWVGAGAFDYFKFVPLNSLTRWFLDDLLHTRMLYRALHASSSSVPYMVQDIAFPYDTAEQFIDYAAAELGTWPLWLCPLKRSAMPTFHPVTADPDDAPAAAAAEDTGASAGAALYAHTYYPERQFWDIYDQPPARTGTSDREGHDDTGGERRTWYHALREK
ncbi:Delta(24)-sterol reductase [Escovopsis weberi]|uniref:Delta(24)-sterol reductase n=1 Tax=Escovopsis weberi TaxID=150374 RepID=A0A0M8N8P2_ESCWE|nr:Delta(24)-sterol reductase [Escovopsis weberi]